LTDETRQELRQSANKAAPFARGRHRQARVAKRNEAPLAKANAGKPAKLSRANSAKPSGASPAMHNGAKVTKQDGVHHHARAPAAPDKHHA